MKIFTKYRVRSAAVSVLSMSLLLTGLMAQAANQKVNPQLAEKMETYKPERLVKLGDRVHAAFGYEYSNYAYIEGDDGVIVVDSGWFPGQAKRSIEDYRKEVTDKPIVAIIYTHLHLDHSGGASAIMEGQNPHIPVYGPEGWEKWVTESFSNLRPAMFRRIYMQMGLVLPHGEEGTVGNGIGPSPRSDGKVELTFPPTINISESTEVTISGVRIQLIPLDGDIPEHLFIWLPDDEVLFAGDGPLATTFPAVETVRFEIDRNPRAHVDALNAIVELDPEYLVPGHGRVLLGREEVLDVTLANRDTVEFMVDQLDRYYIKGYSADQVVDTLKLPPKLAAHPDLQPYYHRVEWMIRQMHVKRAGFVGESMDYVTLTNNQEARRLVPLLGGPEKVRHQAQAALNEKDSRWAARLATYVLEIDPADTEAKSIRQAAFLHIARTTVSSNERNYILSIIKEENGELDWKQIFSKGDYDVIRGEELDAVLGLMKSRFRAEAADNQEFIVQVDVSGESRYYQVRNNVLMLNDEQPGKIDASLTMHREILDRIAANFTTWTEALEAGQIRASSGATTAKQLAALIE